MAAHIQRSRRLFEGTRLVVNHNAFRIASSPRRYFSLGLLGPFALATTPAIQLRIPSLLEDIWESILRAVPKKKTSHRKKRQRFLAGKALKDVTELNKCPGCGHVKKAHTLCPYCVNEIRRLWKSKEKEAKTIESQS